MRAGYIALRALATVQPAPPAKGDRVRTPDGEGVITAITPAIPARYHVLIGPGARGGAYNAEELQPAPKESGATTTGTKEGM
jgi:hypothetical protein